MHNILWKRLKIAETNYFFFRTLLFMMMINTIIPRSLFLVIILFILCFDTPLLTYLRQDSTVSRYTDHSLRLDFKLINRFYSFSKNYYIGDIYSIKSKKTINQKMLYLESNTTFSFKVVLWTILLSHYLLRGKSNIISMVIYLYCIAIESRALHIPSDDNAASKTCTSNQ